MPKKTTTLTQTIDQNNVVRIRDLESRIAELTEANHLLTDNIDKQAGEIFDLTRINSVRLQQVQSLSRELARIDQYYQGLLDEAKIEADVDDKANKAAQQQIGDLAQKNQDLTGRLNLAEANLRDALIALRHFSERI